MDDLKKVEQIEKLAKGVKTEDEAVFVSARCSDFRTPQRKTPSGSLRTALRFTPDNLLRPCLDPHPVKRTVYEEE
jgi:hypothetical protein